MDSNSSNSNFLSSISNSSSNNNSSIKCNNRDKWGDSNNTDLFTLTYETVFIITKV